MTTIRLHTLKNGLTVVLHQDKSDPIAAVAVYYHVGSGREVVGKRGFAQMYHVVAGDARIQMEPLEAVGLGKPLLVPTHYFVSTSK